MRRALPAVPLVLILVGCSTQVARLPIPTITPGSSPVTASPVAVSPVAGSVEPSPSTPNTRPGYGVMIDLLTSPTYYVANLVGIDGRLWAALRLGKRTPISNASGHAMALPYVSTTSTSMYALDGDSSLIAMRVADGSQTVAAKLPVTSGTEAAFAVSPDDLRIAVAILDFNRSPVHVTLYVDNLAGGNKHVIFESSSDYVWPVGWQAGLLVLAHAYGPYEEDIEKVAPGRDNPYSAVSYHVLNPHSGYSRVYLLGGCTVSGPLSQSGSACIQGGTIDWGGGVSDPWSARDWGSISSAASLSPDGSRVAAAEPDNPGRL